jgi:hypothetical protein
MDDFMSKFGHLTPNQLLAGMKAVTTKEKTCSLPSSSTLREMPAFDYKRAMLRSPATSIRLIDLHPPAANAVTNASSHTKPAPISCSIFPASLGSLPPFKALSYVWGPPSRTKHITICNNVFEITSSLFKALQHIRHPTKTITLWIDQICIHQLDPEEKSLQVPLMGQIYRSAEEVLVWLGPAADKSDDLMNVWRQAGQAAMEWGLNEYFGDRIEELGHVFAKSNPKDPKTIAFHDICAKMGPLFDLKALAAWYKRAWFTRVWIVQEFCLRENTVFICGEKKVPVDFVKLAQFVIQIYWGHRPELLQNDETRRDKAAVMKEEPLARLFGARNRRQKYENGKGKGDGIFLLLRELYVQKTMQATDQRDRVFGLLSLATDTEKLGIYPDYTNFDVTQVYLQVARAIVRDGNLDLLGLAQFPKMFVQLPSWVPDWSGVIRPSFCDDGATSKLKFAASGNSQVSLLPVVDERSLALEGYFVDEVEEVGGPWIWRETGVGIDMARYLTYLSDIKMMCKVSELKGNLIYENEGARSSAFWRVPIGDIEETIIRAQQRATLPFAEGYEGMVQDFEFFQQSKLCSSLDESKSLWNKGEPLRKIGERYRSRIDAMGNKRPYLSEKGYVGMGPISTQPGDVIVVLMGGRVPYILRPRGEGKYFFLGEAYCHGIMDGEITTKRKKRGFILI